MNSVLQCANYVHQRFNGVINEINPIDNTADIAIFHDDFMSDVAMAILIVKKEMIKDLEEGDLVVVELINGVPTRCFKVTEEKKNG